MPLWALLGCFLHPFCGEERADHVWKGQVWGWESYCFKGEKTKEWKNEELIFNAQTSCSILLKSLSLSSTLGVLSSKRLTFQAQMLNVLSSKRLTFQAQHLVFYLSKVQPSKPKSLTFKAQTLDVLSLKSLTFQVQMLGVLSLKSLTFKAQCLMFYLSKT